ncbi:MAG: ribonuclease D [Alphaproteobacteria bacterium]|nr:ribonuclease D [Alphaproteobacteria bacterium]
MTRKLSLTVEGKNVAVYVHKGDLPADASFVGPVAVDCEAMGLALGRDRLCLVQISDGGDAVHLVQIAKETPAPRLQAVLADPDTLKILHFARFDLALMRHQLGVMAAPVYCTKIASRLARTYTDRHGLKDVVKELLGRDVSKDQQSSDWGADQLSDSQVAYAAADVVHLHALREKLNAILEREGRMTLAQACFDFLPARAELDVAGWPEIDIFAHS